MPLVGLDEIEWDKLSHAYGSAKDIPNLLRALDAAETKEEFDKNYRELIVRVNHQGDIYDSTAPTVTFLLQILDEANELDKQLSILSYLGSLLRDIQSYPIGFFRNPRELSVTLLRSNIATYDAIANGLEHYLVGIRHENEDIRFASLYTLFALIEQHEEILPALLDCVANVDDGWFQACAVWTLINIETYDWRRQRRSSSIELLNKWLEHANPLVRYTAAFGKLQLSLDSIKDAVTVKTIVEALKADVWHSKGKIWGDKLDIYLEQTPFNDPIHWISNSSGLPDTWIAILAELKPTPLQAHICIAEILKLSFSTKNIEASWPRWRDFTFNDAAMTEIIYHQMIPGKRYQTGNTLNVRERLALQTIVECEPFWEIPTNLFSFFYGLPDDREELRRLAEGK